MFGIELKNIYDLNNIHENDVNSIDVWNLLYDILNPSKCTKNTNSCYSLIRHGFMNTPRGRARYTLFKIF